MRSADHSRPVATLAAALLAASMAACGGGQEARHEAGPPDKPGGAQRVVKLTREAIAVAGIRVETVARQPLDEIVTLAGTLTFDENRVSHVAPRIGARVVRIIADLGQAVRAGQPLALLDSGEFAQGLADWRKASSAFTVRQRDYDRAKRLLEGEAISQGEYLSREGEYQAARSDLASADSRLHLLGLSHAEHQRLAASADVGSGLPLRSPIAGRVISRQVNPGDVVEAGKPLFTVGEVRSLWLVARLYERDLAGVHVGDTVEVQTEAFPAETFAGRIDNIGGEVDAATRTVPARAVIANPSERLKPGMFAEARLTRSTTVPTLVVPRSALQEIDKQPTVFAVRADGAVEARTVTRGRTGKTLMEVTAGVREGERIATQGALSLKAELTKSELGGE